jgi:hypothetical protein
MFVFVHYMRLFCGQAIYKGNDKWEIKAGFIVLSVLCILHLLI